MHSDLPPYDPEAPKRATNVSVNESMVETARRLGINLSRACEQGIRAQIAEVMARRWQEENREAIAASNDYSERHGLPLERFRQF